MASPLSALARRLGRSGEPATRPHLTLPDDAPPGARYRSAFGGLWTDLDAAPFLLASRVDQGRILEADRALIETWIAFGCVVLEGAVSDAMIDRAMADIDAILDGHGPERAMTYWEDGVHRQGPAQRELMARREAKLLDAHAVSGAVRALIFAEPIARFLRNIFDAPPWAFQTLTFERGSQQPVHQDTAFVRVDAPMELAASWIALEDVRPGSGELVYHPQSHLIPDIVFEGGEKAIPAHVTRYETYEADLQQRLKDAGLERKTFLPKKGDVFIWSADLAHGGGPVTDPALTRKSLVTHYCPATREPAYPTGRPRTRRTETPYGEVYSAAY